MKAGTLDVDNFAETNMWIFENKEMEYERDKMYYALSLLCISLIDLGIIEVQND
jgi:hypothetical protein